MKKRLLLIDGNSIMNRAFYGIMGSKVLTSDDGKYTNALYGFLAIMFKNMELSEDAANLRSFVLNEYSLDLEAAFLLRKC